MARKAARKPARKASKTTRRTTARARTKAKAKPKAPARGRALRRKTASAKKPAARRAGKLKLSLMTGPYEIVRALKEGAVKPKGIELAIARFPGGGEIHNAVATGRGAADINEFNGGHYVFQKAHGRDDFTAIPVFLHRRFRHGFIYVNRAKVKSPKDLVGKRIGSVSMGPAANFWMRGYLEEAGVPTRSVTWVIDHADDMYEKRPADYKVEMTPRGTTANDMLLAGEIEGVLSPSITDMIGKHDPRVGRLWPNYDEVERDYYRKTGIFPIMHVTTVPTKLVEKHPWIVESLVHAFEEAKQLAYQHLVNPRIVPLAWYQTYCEREQEMLGPDPWEFGWSEANRRNYDTLIGYVHKQLLGDRPRPRLEDLFAKESFELDLPLPRFHERMYDR